MKPVLDITKHHIGAALVEVASRWPDRMATRVWRDDRWQQLTWQELVTRVEHVAGGLIQAGLVPGARVGLLASNSPEWWLVDLAIQTARGVTVPIYATSTPEQIRHILADCTAWGIVVGGEREAERVDSVRADLPALQLAASFAQLAGYVSLADLESSATPEGLAEVALRLDEATPEDLSGIIYTSGTTGAPKGVMIPHESLWVELRSLSRLLHPSVDDHSLSFLPLSHALERGWECWLMLNGIGSTYVANPREVGEAMVAARPTMMVSVPKLYETVYRTAHQRVADSPIRRAIFQWALRVGGRNQRAYRKGRRPNLWWRAQRPIADRLVLRSIREAMGGPKTILACGGAPLRVEVEEFFSAAGMPILTGYGLTEACPLISFNSPGAFKCGTAGRVMPGGELAIGADSEVLYRGGNLMAGYWNDPTASAQAVRDGWLHTGDVGYVDSDGFLVITDRLKDIIVTLGGKNIAPQPIEGLLLADLLFEHAVIIGDNRPSLTLLVNPSVERLGELAEKLQIRCESTRELFENQEIVAEVKRRVSELTAKLPSHEQIRDLRLLPDSFTLDNGLLTPTLKVRRREAERRFREVIEEMYEKMAELRRQMGHARNGTHADSGVDHE